MQTGSHMTKVKVITNSTLDQSKPILTTFTTKFSFQHTVFADRFFRGPQCMSGFFFFSISCVNMLHLSSDESFNYEILRILAYSRYFGSDIGEFLEAAVMIEAANFESFYNTFNKLAVPGECPGR
jgi:hypothetical protein